MPKYTISPEQFLRTQRIADEQRHALNGVRAMYRRLLRHLLIGGHQYDPLNCEACAEIADELTQRKED